MKIWLIYLKMDGLTPMLYAFTNNKDYYKEFKSERNKNVFKYEEKEVSKDEYYSFANKHRNINLKPAYFETCNETKYDYVRNVVKLMCTYNEESSVLINYDYINHEISKSTDELALLCNTKVLQALDDLYYFDFLKQKMERYGYTSDLSYMLNGRDMEFNESPIDYSYDYLMIFIKRYGHLMNNL